MGNKRPEHASVLCWTCSNAVRRFREGEPRTPCRAGVMPDPSGLSCDSYVRRFPFVVREPSDGRAEA
ncbi:MAG TPA: hypothetical protein VFP44_01495 [Usitatibacter sp.]|nr:hypothetical protein [Usitatibacter sp.]